MEQCSVFTWLDEGDSRAGGATAGGVSSGGGGGGGGGGDGRMCDGHQEQCAFRTVRKEVRFTWKVGAVGPQLYGVDLDLIFLSMPFLCRLYIIL